MENLHCKSFSSLKYLSLWSMDHTLCWMWLYHHLSTTWSASWSLSFLLGRSLERPLFDKYINIHFSIFKVIVWLIYVCHEDYFRSWSTPIPMEHFLLCMVSEMFTSVENGVLFTSLLNAIGGNWNIIYTCVRWIIYVVHLSSLEILSSWSVDQLRCWMWLHHHSSTTWSASWLLSSLLGRFLERSLWCKCINNHFNQDDLFLWSS